MKRWAIRKIANGYNITLVGNNSKVKKDVFEDLDELLLTLNQKLRGGNLCTSDCRWTCQQAPNIIGCGEDREKLEVHDKIKTEHYEYADKISKIAAILKSKNSMEISFNKIKRVMEK